MRRRLLADDRQGSTDAHVGWRLPLVLADSLFESILIDSLFKIFGTQTKPPSN